MLTHLVTLGIENETRRDYVLEGYAIEYHGSDGVQGEEPSTGLIHALVDEVGWIELRRNSISLVGAVNESITVCLCATSHLTLEWVVELGIRH